MLQVRPVLLGGPMKTVNTRLALNLMGSGLVLMLVSRFINQAKAHTITEWIAEFLMIVGIIVLFVNKFRISKQSAPN